MLLADQDRALWNDEQIAEGRAALDRALALRGRGPYVLQAAIASLQADDPLDWPQIAALYGELARLTGSPVVELNRAVAVAEATARRPALAIVDAPRPRRLPATCTPPAPSSCAGSAAPTRRAPPTGARSSSPRGRRSGASSSGGSPSSEAGCPLRGGPSVASTNTTVLLLIALYLQEILLGGGP